MGRYLQAAFPAIVQDLIATGGLVPWVQAELKHRQLL